MTNEQCVQAIKSQIPDYAKDIRLNIDSVLLRSSLEGHEAFGAALAASFAAKSSVLVTTIRETEILPEKECQAALTAASLMGMNNIWYPYVEMSGNAELKGQPAGLRMNAYANHGGTTKRKFELYALAASGVGKCHFCVKSHFETLLREGMTVAQLGDVGRIAATMNAAAQIIAAQAA